MARLPIVQFVDDARALINRLEIFIANQKQEFSVATMFVNGSKLNEQTL
jgi:hypothetical protein